MIVFSLSLGVLSLLFVWQLVVCLRAPQGVGVRKMILVRLMFLVVIMGLVTYAWRSALLHEVRFLSMLPPYPNAHLDILHTPIFSGDPYWTYIAPATGDQIFNWYRSRAKHAGWTMADEGAKDARVFAMRLDKKTSLFVVLAESNGETVITYTTEGEVMRQTISQ
jgi:hypothetical protein